MKEMLRDLGKDIWNVPNLLTMARLAMIPVFIALDLTRHFTAALIVFCLTSLTDCLDGFLARKNNQVTNFGKLFDPLADKLMVVSALICHTAAGHFPWPAVCIVAAKELLMVLGGAYMLKKGIVVYANFSGKIATVFFMAALILGFFHDRLAAFYSLDVLFLWAAVGLTLLALVIYASQAFKSLKKAA